MIKKINIGYHPEVEELFEHKKEKNMAVSILTTKYVEKLLDLGAEFKTNGVYRLGRFDFYPNKYKARDFRTNETLSIRDALDEVIESNLDSYETTLDPDKIPETFEELVENKNPIFAGALIQTEITTLILILENKGLISSDELNKNLRQVYKEFILPLWKPQKNTDNTEQKENEEKDENV